MKKPIKTSHVLALLSFVMFPLVLTFFNFTTGHKITTPSPLRSDRPHQPLSGKIIARTTYVDPSDALRIDLKFVDTVLLLPSKRDYVTIQGDSVLLSNIEVEKNREHEGLYLRHKLWHENMNTEEELPSVLGLQNTKVKVIIGYSTLKSVNIYQPLKALIQKGVLKGANIDIHAVCDIAALNVEADYLDVALLKPDRLPKGDIISTTRMKTYFRELKKSQMHQIKGKADLVRLMNNSSDHLYLNLAELKCRQVSIEVNSSSYNKIIASPDQLLSSTLSASKGFFLPEHEFICLSKAKVVHAYRTNKGIVRYR